MAVWVTQCAYATVLKKKIDIKPVYPSILDGREKRDRSAGKLK